ncbi:hypothetical protein ACFV1L_05920 [Kitasatospora sp. NPDC059646]|uniref:hypothetical protein n=1 Tax=Kitasatospora sp. NPDC059646 TaxID=3346893 RepID=UPI00368396EC
MAFGRKQNSNNDTSSGGDADAMDDDTFFANLGDLTKAVREGNDDAAAEAADKFGQEGRL